MTFGIDTKEIKSKRVRTRFYNSEIFERLAIACRCGSCTRTLLMFAIDTKEIKSKRVKTRFYKNEIFERLATAM